MSRPWTRYDFAMAMPPILDREEYIEQVYFFRVFRERVATNSAAQDVLDRIHDEILATTRLPLAIQFLATELKHSGLLSSGFARLSHYFTPYQSFLIRQTEDESFRFSIETALLILEREAQYKAGQAQPAGLFVFQFEVLSRNRLGYDDGLQAMTGDPLYNDNWRGYLDMVRRQVGVRDFADLVYVRSELYVSDRQRQDADYTPPVPPLFSQKEGRIARANRGRDPLYLFAALQRQLGYPEVPRPRTPDDIESKLIALAGKLRQLEQRLQIVESEAKGQLDLSQFMKKPELLEGPPGDEDS